MNVWIDLSNSPHPLLFAPIASALEERGHRVLVTARDNAQTVELAQQRWPAVEVIGGPSPGGRARKAATVVGRIRALTSWARRHRPEVAVSHNSYAQIVAGRISGARVVTAMDFEHQPANHLAFRLAHSILLPEALGTDAVRRQGATGAKVRHYAGLKEEIYLGDFVPDSNVLDRAGLARRTDSVLVVARTPPSRALYHQFDNRLFLDLISLIGKDPAARCIVLPRHPEQRRELQELRLPSLVIPDRALDSRSLMYAADLVIGAGGTMTREAALLGVPTVSVFAGSTPAVDRWLIDRGALRRVTRAEEILPLAHRASGPVDVAHLQERSRALVEFFTATVT